ncbi:MAG: XRE family transcriptional regulator [Acutalibacteraceae bacterium]|nr:XRE family transcriptional regulator [Acutalibacteraceae bacterium]
MPSFAERLNEALERRNMTAAELARALNVADATISNYKKGIYAPKQRRTEEISKILNVSIPWLMGADVPMKPLNLVSPNVTEDVVTFPVIGNIAAGYEEIAVEDWSGETIDVPRSFLKGRSKSDFFVLKVHGDSMYPIYHTDDKVLILRQTFVERSGDVGAVIYDGECATLKRVEIFDDMVRLSPLNPSYPPKELTGANLEQYHIIGVPYLLVREIIKN